jgi:site-specific recombinase XerD
MLLSEVIEALLVATRADGRSPATVEFYRRKLRPLLAFLGDVEVEVITVQDLRRYRAYLMDRPTRWPDHPEHDEVAGGLSPFTIAAHARAEKRLFNWLEAEGVLPVNPSRRLKTPQPRRREPKGISRSDLLALLATTEAGGPADLRDRAVMLFLADTGCRVGGLCRLRIEDLDFEAGLASVTEKRGKTRLVPFNPPTSAALQAWLEVRPGDRGPWVFVSLGNKAQGALSRNGVAQMLKRRARCAGVTGPVNPHAFRHAFARGFLLSGGDLAALSELMGHSGVEITKDYYAIFTIQELQEKHRRYSPVAQMFGGSEDGNS